MSWDRPRLVRFRMNQSCSGPFRAKSIDALADARRRLFMADFLRVRLGAAVGMEGLARPSSSSTDDEVGKDMV